MQNRCMIGALLVGIGVGIALGVIMQVYWFYMVLFCIITGLWLLRA